MFQAEAEIAASSSVAPTSCRKAPPFKPCTSTGNSSSASASTDQPQSRGVIGGSGGRSQGPQQALRPDPEHRDEEPVDHDVLVDGADQVSRERLHEPDDEARDQ